MLTTAFNNIYWSFDIFRYYANKYSYLHNNLMRYLVLLLFMFYAWEEMEGQKCYRTFPILHGKQESWADVFIALWLLFCAPSTFSLYIDPEMYRDVSYKWSPKKSPAQHL